MNSGESHKPAISVIVPNYNHARYLRARLESVLRQTVSDIEVLLLDDASTDASLEVAANFTGDPRVRLSVNESNSGNPFAQWRAGLHRARGELVWIAESDDAADLRFLERMVGVLDAHPEAGLATCRSMMIDENDRELGLFDAFDWFKDRERWSEDYCNAGQDEVRDYLLHQNTIPNASAVVFRRKLAENAMDALPGYRIAGDWFFWVSILLHSDICHVSEPLNRFRTARASSQRAKTLAEGIGVAEALRVIEHVEAQCRLDDRDRLGARMSLVRLWLSLESLSPQGWARNRETRRLITRGAFHSRWASFANRLMTGLALSATPFSGIPGFRSLGAWTRDRLRGLRPRGASR